MNTKASGSSASASAAGPFSERLANITLAALVLLLLFVVFNSSLASPGLIDEQYLLAWLKSCLKLHGSSGFGGFMSIDGLDAADGWGITTKLFLLILATILPRAMFLFKATSLFLHCAATFLTYLCSKQISKSAVVAAIATFLFAVYPLHFEAVSWLGGVGAELSTIFFLISLLAYLQGRNSELSWKRVAVIGGGMFLSITSSTLIWPACLSFGLYELVCLALPEADAKRRDLTMSMIAALMPVLIVGVCLAASGGINAAFLPDLQPKNLIGFFKRVIFPINEINWKRYSREYLVLYALYPFIGLSLLSCFWGPREQKRSLLFSFLLFLLMACPLIGVSIVDSHLYGERWLYAAAVPLCLFLATCISGLANLNGKMRYAGIAGATIVSIVLVLVFARHLSNENAANRNFARVLKAVQKCARKRQEKEPVVRFIVTDLPERISVCPLYSPRGPVLFDPQTGLVGSNPIPAGRYKEQLREGKLRESSVRWDEQLKTLMPLDLGQDKAPWPEKMNADEFSGRMAPGAGFYKNVHFNSDKSELILDPISEQGPVITLDPGDLSTTDGDYLYIDAIIDAPAKYAGPRIEMHWQTRVHRHYEKRERFTYTPAIINDGKVHHYLLSLRANGWTTGGIPTLIALGFPSASHVRITGGGLVRMHSGMMPQLNPVSQDCADRKATRFTPPFYNYPIDPELGMTALSESAESLNADYSVADIPEAIGVSVELSYPNRFFDDANSNHLTGQCYKTFSQKGQEGRISIPISELPGAGVYSLRVIARDTKGVYLGQFSNQVCYQVPRGRKEN